MPRVIGIDPGTVSIDLCGLDDGALFLDCSLPTASALADPARFVATLERAGPLDLIVGPSGYGLPMRRAAQATDDEMRLAFLAAEGDHGGIGGLRALARALARTSLPVVFTPGVIHLDSVPSSRKVNRVDMGTADKVCAAALAIADQSLRRRCPPPQVSLVLLELGGAFTAALAVDGGRIVDWIGGTGGPLGMRSAGALDAEVAFLAGQVDKSMVFRGGAASVSGSDDITPERLAERASPGSRVAWDAYIESAVKAVAALTVSVRHPHEIVLSGRVARVAAARVQLAERLSAIAPIRVADGFAKVAKEGAQGAAIVADGLAGGRWSSLVETMGIREARGTALDHLHVIDPSVARRTLGIA